MWILISHVDYQTLNILLLSRVFLFQQSVWESIADGKQRFGSLALD